MYGEDNILSVPGTGTIESIESITMDDLKDFYSKALSPSVARMHVVGKINQERVMSGLGDLVANWKPVDIVFPTIDVPQLPERNNFV